MIAFIKLSLRDRSLFQKLLQHLLLLVIEHNYRQKTSTLDPEQAVLSVLKGVCFEMIKVSADASKLIPELFTDLLY